MSVEGRDKAKAAPSMSWREASEKGGGTQERRAGHVLRDSREKRDVQEREKQEYAQAS